MPPHWSGPRSPLQLLRRRSEGRLRPITVGTVCLLVALALPGVAQAPSPVRAAVGTSCNGGGPFEVRPVYINIGCANRQAGIGDMQWQTWGKPGCWTPGPCQSYPGRLPLLATGWGLAHFTLAPSCCGAVISYPVWVVLSDVVSTSHGRSFASLCFYPEIKGHVSPFGTCEKSVRGW